MPSLALIGAKDDNQVPLRTIYDRLDTLDVEYTRCDDLTRVLNITITRDRKNRIITISQPDYCEKMLETFNMAGDDVKPVATPQVTGPNAYGKLDKTMCPSTTEKRNICQVSRTVN